MRASPTGGDATPWSTGLTVTEGDYVSSENQTSAWSRAPIKFVRAGSRHPVKLGNAEHDRPHARCFARHRLRSKSFEGGFV